LAVGQLKMVETVFGKPGNLLAGYIVKIGKKT